MTLEQQNLRRIESHAETPKDNRLEPKLTWIGVLMLTLSCLSPVLSVCGTGADVLHQVGTGAAPMFFVGIGAAVVWAIVYAELGSAYPYAGGDYVGVGSTLGPWAGFASLTIWASTTPCMNAFLGQIIATYLRNLLPAAPAFTVSLLSIAGAVAVALFAVRASTLVTGIFLSIEIIIVIALTYSGFAHPARGLADVMVHPQMLDSAGALRAVDANSLTLAALSAAFATVGGNQAIAFGEELVQPHLRMGRVILLAGIIGALTTALPVISLVIGAPNLVSTLGSPAPFSNFMEGIGGPTAARCLSIGVVLAVFNALVAQIMFSARMFFSIGRDRIFSHRLGLLLSSVHRRTGVPRFATYLVGLISVGCCFFQSHTLLVFSSGLVVYSLLLVSLAVLAGRVRGLTGKRGQWRSPCFPTIPAMGLCLAVAFGIADYRDTDVGRPALSMLGGVIAVALIWYRVVLARRPGGWAPWLGQ
jgi:amino acid transporter